MPDDRIETLRRGYAEYNSGEWDTAVARLHEDIEWADPTDLPGAATHRGRDEVLAWWKTWNEAWGEVTMEPEEYIEQGDLIVVPFRMRATGASSGVPIDLAMTAVWWFEDGTARRVAHYTDRNEALRAAQ